MRSAVTPGCILHPTCGGCALLNDTILNAPGFATAIAPQSPSRDLVSQEILCHTVWLLTPLTLHHALDQRNQPGAEQGRMLSPLKTNVPPDKANASRLLGLSRHRCRGFSAARLSSSSCRILSSQSSCCRKCGKCKVEGSFQLPRYSRLGRRGLHSRYLCRDIQDVSTRSSPD